jgi:hypothetical protein
MTHLRLSTFLICAYSMMAQATSSHIEDQTQSGGAPRDAKQELKMAEDYYFGSGVPLDYKQAFVHYKNAADQGSAEGQTALGYLYLNGVGVAQNDAQAALWYGRAAEQGNAVAQAMLGDLCQIGRGVTRDQNTAAEWYRRSAKQGFAGGQHQLGLLYLNGEGALPKDPVEAATWFKSAADQGYAPAQKDLGLLYFQGRGVKQDYALAANMLTSAAKSGVSDAQAFLADLYASGRGVGQDYAQAVLWARRSADQNDPIGQFELAALYALGQGVKQDYAEAYKLATAGAKRDSTPSQFLLAVLYLIGGGVPQSDSEALTWARRAAEGGFPFAQHLLAQLLINGRGTQANVAEAITWFQKAADSGIAGAQSALGNLCLEGNGVPKNDAEAVRFFRAAAEQGFAEAQNMLGLLYLRGQGVPNNDAEAFAWFTRASDQGNPFAEYNLAGMYEKGRGTKTDTATSLKLYTKAADQGLPPAQYYQKAADKGSSSAQRELATLYRNGLGVPKDDSRAFTWYRRAAEQGDFEAETMLGYSYLEGRGANQSVETGLQWLRKSANAGSAEAQYILGILYQNGRWVSTDTDEAKNWFHRAASQGYVRAQERLENMAIPAVASAARPANTTGMAQPARGVVTSADFGNQKCQEYYAQEREQASRQTRISQLEAELRDLRLRYYQTVQGTMNAQQTASGQARVAGSTRGGARTIATITSIFASAGAIGGQVQQGKLQARITDAENRLSALANSPQLIKYSGPPEGCAPAYVAAVRSAPSPMIEELAGRNRSLSSEPGRSGIFGGLQGMLENPSTASGNIVGGLTDLAKRQAYKKFQQELLKRVGEAAGLGSPLLLNQKAAFREAPAPKDFHPRQLTVATTADLLRPLPPGDYSIVVRAYCTQWSIHVPGGGIPYKLAPVEGKQAAAISALLVNGTIQGVAPSELQAASWRIQSGTPLSQMPPSDQALIARLIPQHTGLLQGDYVQQIEQIYAQLSRLPKVPSLDSLLEGSEPGRVIQNILRARQTLADQTISAERLPDVLYEPQPDGLPRVLPPSSSPKPSPWAEIRQGVVGRLTVQQGNFGRNLFELRISASARSQHASSRPAIRTTNSVFAQSFLPQSELADAAENVGVTLTQVLGLGIQNAAADASLLIGYSIGKAAQALIVLPLMEERQSPPPREVTYVGPDHPLVKLGMSLVWKAIDYPERFTFPTISSPDRQQLVDLFTQREILRSIASLSPRVKRPRRSSIIRCSTSCRPYWMRLEVLWVHPFCSYQYRRLTGY